MQKRNFMLKGLFTISAVAIVLVSGWVIFLRELPSGNREFPSGSIELGSGSRMQYEGEARKAVVEELVTMTAKLLADGHYQESAALIVQGLSLAPNSTELLALKAVVEQITQAHRNGGEESLSAVDRVLKTLKEANIAFNAPAELRVHETATIHLLLDATRDAEELEVMLTGEGERDSATVRMSEKMEARLTGSNFEITAITSEIQAVSRLQPTEWKWEVEPTESGEQHLHLTLSALIDPGDGLTPRVIRTFDKIVKVKVRWHKKVVAFAGNNWQWLWATLLVPTVGWIWKKRKEQKMG